MLRFFRIFVTKMNMPKAGVRQLIKLETMPINTGLKQ